MRIVAIVLAAGQGSRMKSQIKKQFLRIGDKPILFYSLNAFESCQMVDEIILVCAQEDLTFVAHEIVDRFGLKKVKKLVSGGEERQDSVLAGLEAIDEPVDFVAIHDGVRPFLNPNKLRDAFNLAFNKKAVIFAAPILYTVKQVEGGQVAATIPRERLWEVQTPQIFEYSLILDSYRKAKAEGFKATDDSMMVERIGFRPFIFENTSPNPKITTPEDLDYARYLLERESV